MRHNLKVRKYFRLLLAFLSTVFLIILVWIMVDCFTTKRTASKKVITYDVQDDLTYQVNLKDNKFFNSDTANDKNSYVTSLIDDLNINFNYDLNGTALFNSDYRYRADVYLKSLNDEGVTWNYHETVLNEMEERVVDSTNIKLHNDIGIDFNHLYSLADEFHALTNYDVKLEVVITISSELYVKNSVDTIKDVQVLSLSMPMTKQITSITKTSDKNINRQVFSQFSVDERFNAHLFLFSSLLAIAIFPMMILSYVALFNLVNLDDYDHKLKAIQRKYARLLEKSSSVPRIKNKELVELNNMRTLVDTCRDQDLMIKFYERVKGKECWFYSENAESVYLYILRLDHKPVSIRDTTPTIGKRKTKKKKR